jgi:hypothetical protein
MTALLGWLIGSRWGRRAALALLALAMIAIALRRVQAGGYRAREAEEAAARIAGVMERIKTDEDIRRLDPRARRDALRRWVRDPAPEHVLR